MTSWTMQPYSGIDGLQDIVLEESYVLGITATPGRLAFTMYFVLTPDHPLYRPYAPAETFACYRHGELCFQTVTSLRWSDQGKPPAQDATGEFDYDHIDYFEWKPGCYRLEGCWGVMEVIGGGHPGHRHRRRHGQPRMSPEAAGGLPLRVRQAWAHR